MKKISVLIVEDEETLAMILKDTLEEQNFSIHLARDGEEGLRLFAELHPDVLVADVMMPRMDGFEMVRRIRRQDSHTPVLFLTARSAINDVVAGFELGANDYLRKPFSIQELIIRIKNLLGKAYQAETAEANKTQVLEIGDYLLNTTTQQLFYTTESCINLSYRECEILRFLSQAQDQVVTMQTILLQLWGDDTFFNQRSLHVFITKLRRKLSKDHRIRIVNVRGIGYKLIVE